MCNISIGKEQKSFIWRRYDIYGACRHLDNAKILFRVRFGFHWRYDWSCKFCVPGFWGL